MNAQRLMWVALAMPCVLLLCLVLEVAPAFGEHIYVPGVAFGSSGSGPGQFTEPNGVAVNDASAMLEPTAGGDVYVVDKGDDRVERFTASGEYEGQFNGSETYEVEGKIEHGKHGAAPTGALSNPEQIAVDNCTNKLGERCSIPEDEAVGDVYVTDDGHKVIDKFTATGEYLGQLTVTEVCEATGEEYPCPDSKKVRAGFFELQNITVDSSGDLWVYEKIPNAFGGSGYLAEFGNEGAFIERLDAAIPPWNNYGFAISAAGFYVGGGFDKNVYQIPRLQTQRQEEHGNWLGEFNGSETALAVIPETSPELAGRLLVDSGGIAEQYAVPFTKEDDKPLPVETFPGEGLAESYGIAVNSSATVYASDRGKDQVQSFRYVAVPKVVTEAPTGVTETDLRFHGTVNPEGEGLSECYFEYGTELGKYTHTVECEPAASEITGTESMSVTAGARGLEPANVRSFRLVAVNAGGIKRDGAEMTVSRPGVGVGAPSAVETATATIDAEINPGNLASCWWVEYGATTAYGMRAPREGCLPVGEGGEPEAVHVGLMGLSAATAYHFRIAGSNALGLSDGPDRVFTTYGQTESALPDGRVYELVSSLGKGDATEVYARIGLMLFGLDELNKHGIASGRPTQATAGGETIAYVGDPPSVGGNGEVGSTLGNEYLARRLPSGGWGDIDLTPEARGEYLAFSGDLSVGLLSGEGLTPVPSLGYTDVYRRATMSTPAFESLVPAAPQCSGTEFGSVWANVISSHELLVAGGNAGTDAIAPYTHVVYESNSVLPSTPTAPPTAPTAKECGPEDNLYDSVDGQLYLVSVRPDGQPHAGADIGLHGSDSHGYNQPDVSNAISADGSRIYWSEVESEEERDRPEALYVRENDTQAQSALEGVRCLEPTKACTVQVDLAQGGAGASGDGHFLSASSDGSRVFFTDENPLTPGSSAAPGEPDLYEYDLERSEGERLSDLSVPPTAGAHADVQGLIGSSEEGSYVYFAANGVLTEGENAEGREPAAGQPNVYLRHNGVTTFIATLSAEDGNLIHGGEGAPGDWQPDAGRRTAEVTPDGQAVVFMSRRALTGYDNLLDGVDLTEVFVYDAQTQRLTCASCNPSGEPPVAEIYPEYLRRLPEVWGAFVPVSGSEVGWQPRVVSQDGKRVFFDSIEPLVPQDRSGYLSVYEWEAPGEGSCTAQAASSVTGGCTYLLSGAANTENSYLSEASANGNDAFFVSRADLVKSDHTDYSELYDARVGGVEQAAETRCSGTACQGLPPTPPIFATPASATFEGVGNFTSAAADGATKSGIKSKVEKCGKKKQHKCVQTRKKVKKKVKKKAKRAKAVGAHRGGER